MRARGRGFGLQYRGLGYLESRFEYSSEGRVREFEGRCVAGRMARAVFLGFFDERPTGLLSIACPGKELYLSPSAPLNLLQPFGHMGLFDVIFCRNVMIYFEQSTRDRLVEDLLQQLSPGGFLFTGHSETLLRLPASLRYVQPATYRKV